jgi:glycosyltransferase involved in cell wall biosynthesis
MKELLYAIDKVHTKVPDVHLYLAGNYEEKCWKTEVEKRSTYVTCTGWITGHEKEKLMQDTCSVFVLPSYYEGQPMSLMEAMSYGLAPVASNIGGVTEMMSENEGISVPVRDAEALYDALLRIIPDTEGKTALGKASRLKIINEYSIEKTIEDLCKIYDNLTE